MTSDDPAAPPSRLRARDAVVLLAVLLFWVFGVPAVPAVIGGLTDPSPLLAALRDAQRDDPTVYDLRDFRYGGLGLGRCAFVYSRSHARQYPNGERVVFEGAPRWERSWVAGEGSEKTWRRAQSIKSFEDMWAKCRAGTPASAWEMFMYHRARG